ncbi:MAG: hypothetical protein C0434_08110 [Xanthomonadaceae bacterium]|nr:hypothetical protein [Xanthomonadaceae bacterium]
MSGIGAGQFYRQQAQGLLTQAAQDETQRDLKNQQIEQADKDAKGQLGASAGSLAGMALGSAGGPVGMAAGAAIGAIAGGLLGRKF